MTLIYFRKLSASYQTDINKIFNEPKKQSVPAPTTDQNNRINRQDDNNFALIKLFFHFNIDRNINHSKFRNLKGIVLENVFEMKLSNPDNFSLIMIKINYKDNM